MSQSQRLIVNCGVSCVTAALVSREGQRPRIDRVVSEDLVHDYSDDDSWVSSLETALHTLSREHGLKGRADLIIPGNKLLTKTIRIPHVEAEKQAQIIAYEAQQNIPYPLSEVVWDSQIVGDDGVETEVLFIACKDEAIRAVVNAANRASLRIQTIGAASVLDYNAVQFARPEVEGDGLLINVGARSTNLTFWNDDGFFIRNIQLGGNSLTQNIADSVGKPFTQAESLKLKFFQSQETFSSEDSGTQALRSSADAFMRRMSQEVTRSIVNYRRQKTGGAPKKIFLAGRGSLLPGLSDHLAETQKVPVDYFDPLDNVEIDGSVDADFDVLRLQLSEIIGEAAVDLVPNPAGINLLPPEIQAAREFKRKKPFLLLAAACLAASPFPAYYVMQKAAAAYEQREEALEKRLPKLRSLRDEIQDHGERAEELIASIERIEGLVNSKSNWIQFFAELQQSLYEAEDVWLDELEVVREVEEGDAPSYQVAVGGQMLVREPTGSKEDAIGTEVLSQRINKLRRSFESSEFIVSARPPSISWESYNKGLNVLPFRIQLIVDTEKPL